MSMLYAAAITLAAAAVATDLRSRRILNWLTLPALGAGVTIGLVNGGFGGLATSLVGILVGGGLLLGPTLIGAMGAGDLKFQSAMGALLGPWFAAIALAVAAIFGGLLAAGYVVWAMTRRRALALGVVATILLQALPNGA
tara:strand:- start:689 stop:1108 length:420 start_codon:yes stop_codon:yes gene_type:complete